MSNRLPPNLARLFMPRPPLKYLPPADRDPDKLPRVRITGLASFIEPLTKDYVYVPPEEKVIPEKVKQREEKLKKAIAKWNPNKDEKIVSDPYKTLFVGRLSYDTTEKKLRRIFEDYGAVKGVWVIRDLNDKPRGYAFIEFEREKDMKSAYKSTDRMKIDSRRVIVDVERGRTVKNWQPAKLGKGLGNTRRSPIPRSRDDSRSQLKFQRSTNLKFSPARRYESSRSRYRHSSQDYKPRHGHDSSEKSFKRKWSPKRYR